ncbi:hypothetical protein ACLB2K_003309 [Fragaria x ananassa]
MSEMEGSGSEMTTISRHHFGDGPDQQDFSVSIIECSTGGVCLAAKAAFCWRPGATVVELGAGTSLPGLVAAKVGADVTLTDESSRLEVLSNMRSVIELNKLQCNVVGLTWGVWDASVFSLHPKFILGADVLYDAKAFDDLFATVAYLLQNSPGSVIITTYHNRSGHHLIEFLMVKWGLKCTRLLDAFSFMPSCKSSGLSGDLQLAEIVLGSERS